MPQEFPAIRLVALDLDGTLLNSEGHVTPRKRAPHQHPGLSAAQPDAGGDCPRSLCGL